MTGELPAPLPVAVRPDTGEDVDSFIRRLARANHLRPSLLHVYVRDPIQPTRAIKLKRLAAISGRTPMALTYALNGLPKPRKPASARPPAQSRQATRKRELFSALRADAEQGLSIRHLAARHRTHRRLVRQALACPTPPTRKPSADRPAPILGPHRAAIDRMVAEEALTTWQIWTRLVDHHDAAVSYGAVTHYLRRRDRTPRATEHPGQTSKGRRDQTQPR